MYRKKKFNIWKKKDKDQITLNNILLLLTVTYVKSICFTKHMIERLKHKWFFNKTADGPLLFYLMYFHYLENNTSKRIFISNFNIQLEVSPQLTESQAKFDSINTPCRHK